MNWPDSAEVENFVRTDSAVITGRLIMKYYPWWAGKGNIFLSKKSIIVFEEFHYL
jgi:hypothetical protein